jgi:hypothetical protein
VEKGHGRIEWRGLEVRPMTPEQMGFPHVAQLARLDRIRELKTHFPFEKSLKNSN